MGTMRLMASASNAPALMSLAMMPGATAFTVTPRLAHSSASDFTAACSAPLAAA